MSGQVGRNPWHFSEEFVIDLLTLKGSGSEEILGQTDEPKNWKGMIVAIAIILFASGIIVAAIMLVMPKQHTIDQGAGFAIDDIFDSKYQPLPVSLQWLPGAPARFVHRDSHGDLRLSNAEGSESTVLMSNETLKSIDRATLSSSRAYVLLSSETFHRRSHIKLAKYTVYDHHQKKECRLRGHGDFLQYAAWIPNSNRIVFIDRNDVYLLADACQPSPSGAKALSSSGMDMDGIYNGIPDPLYEDEILKTDNALWPSDDGKWLVYATFNDSQLISHKIATYDSDLNEYSPVVRSIHYPKAGNTTRNPEVTLSIVNTRNISEGRQMKLPQILTASEYYMTSAKWVDSGNFFVSWLRRDYKHAVHVICEAETAKCSQVWFAEYSNDEGQLCSSTSPPIFASKGSQPTYFFLSFTRSSSDGNFYKHIRKYDSSKGSTTEITTGAHDDIAILAYDIKTGFLFYLSTGGDPRDRQLFRVSDDGAAQPTCVSCEIRGCEYVDAAFSDDGAFYLLSCLGPGVPKHVLRSTYNQSSDVVLQDNADLARALEKKARPSEHRVKVHLEGHSTWARVLVPASHRPELLRRHSLVVIVPELEGPDARNPAAKRFRIGWETVLAREHVVAMLDSRGSDNHGLNFKMAIHGSAGAAEGLDVMLAARALMANGSLGIDASKPSVVVGEGYGGFVALHAQRAGTPFNCSVVTSPITDLGQYYTATAERFMKTSNKHGVARSYEETSTKRFVGELKNTRMLIIHELADDRYHFQNTAILTKDLQLSGIQFESQISAFSRTRAGQAEAFKRYYYQKVLKFLNKCLS